MKNVKKLLLTTVFATLLGVGAFAGFSAVKDEAKVEQAQALSDTGSIGDYLFFTPSTHWAEAGATFKMQWYKNGAYQDSAFMDKVTLSSGSMAENDTYYAVAPVAFDAVQILRFNPGKNEQWNYSNNSSVSGSYRWIYMDPSCNWDNTWTTSSGSNVAYWKGPLDVVYKYSDQSASLNTGRVFVNNSNSHYSLVGVRAWGGSASTTIAGTQKSEGSIYLCEWFQDDNGCWYGYADIPTDVTGYNFIKLTEDDSYNAKASYTSSNSFIPDSFAYVRYAPGEGDEFTTGGAHDKVAGANLMKKVIEAYSTCNSSVLNGYGAYNALNSSFYSFATAAAKAATHTSLGGQSRSIQVHFEAMAARSTGKTYVGAAILGNNINSTSGSTAAIIVAVSAVIAASGFFFFKKKRISK